MERCYMLFFTPFSCEMCKLYGNTNVQVILKTFVCLKIAKKKSFKTGAKVTYNFNQSLILKCLVSGDSRLVTNVEYALFDSKYLQIHQNSK